MEFAQAEVWGKTIPQRSERVFGSLELPKPESVQTLVKRLSESKRINWYWILWANRQSLTQCPHRERNLVFPTLSSFVVLSFVFIVWTLCIFVFIKEFSFTFKFWFCFTLSLILRPTRETQRTSLILRNFSGSRQAYERSSSVKVLCIYFKSHFILRPTKGNIRIFAWFCEIVASRQVYERSSSIKSLQSFKSSKL